MSRAFPLFLLLALLIAGCKNRDSTLAGVWKAQAVKPVTSPNLGDVQRSVQLSLATQNLQFEFTKEHTFKFSAGIGAGTGRYEWKSDVLELTFNTFAPQVPLRFKLEGNKLVEATEFESDPKIVLEKQS